MTDAAHRYSMTIRWSDEDETYIVALPEWEGRLSNWHSATHGETYEAAANGREVLEMLIDVEHDEGRTLPEPRVYLVDQRAMVRVPA